MATVTLQRVKFSSEIQSRAITGAITGTLYTVDPLGRVTVDTRDAAYMIPGGWVVYTPGSGFGTVGSSGVTTISFGAFPGSSTATATIAAGSAADPNAIVDAWITPIATADHSADEHAVDPPMLVAAVISGSNIVITANPSGRDLAVPPGTPFGNTANSQMPIGQQQCMPYGAWTVAWAFSP